MIYDKKTFWKSLVILVMVTGLMYVSGGAGFVIVVPFAFVAFFRKKPDAAFFWVMVAIAMMMGNQNLMPKDVIFALSQRGLLMAFGCLIILQLLGGRKSPIVSPFLLLLPYVFFAVLPSMLGWMPVISYLKLVLFFVIYVGFWGVANQVAIMPRPETSKLRAMALAVAAFFLIGSILLIPFPAIGQLREDEYVDAILRGREVLGLFKGMTMHSQSLGPIVSMFAVFIFSDWVFGVRRFSWMHAVLLMCCPVISYMTSSRTAMGSLLLGLLFACFCVMRERGVGARWRGKVKNAIFAAIGFAVIAVIAIPAARDSVVRFALKWDRNAVASDFTMERALMTRQSKIDSALSNFEKSPLIGNGFQVSEEMASQRRKSWKEYLSAPVEKGVWITAVLEETGIIGMGLLLLFAIGGGLKLMARRAYISLSLLFTVFVVNLGEFTMFSISYTGGLAWLFVFIGAAMDALRLREDQNMRIGYGAYGMA